MSLQARITLGVGVAVAVILAAFGYSATWAIRESTSTVLQDRLQIAEVLAGQIAATLAGDPSALRDAARTFREESLRARGGASLNIEIIDARGIVRASSGQNDVSRPSEHLPVIAALARQGRAGIVFHDLPGYPHYIAYAPLPGYPGWAVGVEQPRDLVLSLPYGLERRMALLGAVIVGGMSLLAFLDVRRVVRPLARLREAAEQIAGGDLDHPVQVDRRDEVGALARTFETMRATLKTSREEIAAWNRELEDRVGERTRALQAMAAENARLFAVARREERNLASTVDLLSDGLLTLTLDRRILSLNPAAERLLGWTSEGATGLGCSELLACPGCLEGHAGTACLLQAALGSGRPVRGIHLRARRRGGATFPVSLTAGLGRDETDRPTHFIVTISDMTTEEAYEQQLRKRIRQLTVLHEVAQALNLLPLRTVEETARDIMGKITAVTGGRCRLDLEPLGDRLPVTVPASAGAGDEQGRSNAGLLEAPLGLQGRRIGTLWLDPGPTEFIEGNSALVGIIANQVAVAVENAKLYEEVRDRDALRRQLLERIVTAQEEERHRIARELHDEIGQALTALVMQLGGVMGILPPDAGALRERLAGIREMTSQTVGDVRRLMLNLRPAVLDDLGLVPAIRWYAEAHLRPAGIEAQVSVAGLDEHQRLPGPLELGAFRLAQEALTNVVRHARATRVTIDLNRATGTLALSIRDNGCGFDVERRTRPGQRGGWGLAGMRERAALLGGSMIVASQPGRGTSVTVTLPVEDGADGR
jgi:PAS domain S-box-containing protein